MDMINNKGEKVGSLSGEEQALRSRPNRRSSHSTCLD